MTTFRRMVLPAALTFGVVGNVFGQGRWMVISVPDDVTLSIDTTTILQLPDSKLFRLWEEYRYTRPQTMFSKPEIQYTRMLDRTDFDCSQNRIRFGLGYFYDSKRVVVYTGDASSPWQEVAPDTYAEVSVLGVCKFLKQSGRLAR